MAKKEIDLSGIKEKSLEETTTFTDLMSRREKRKRRKEEMLDDIEEMVKEKKKNTQDLTREMKKIKENNNETKPINKKDNSKKRKIVEELNDSKDETLSNTQILELTRKMKFNFDDVKEENTEKKKKGVSLLNIIGIINLICIGYYIYLLAFTSYQDNETNYMIAGGFIISLVFFFGLSLVCNKKLRKVFNIINILAIILFILFSIYVYIK